MTINDCMHCDHYDATFRETIYAAERRRSAGLPVNTDRITAAKSRRDKHRADHKDTFRAHGDRAA